MFLHLNICAFRRIKAPAIKMILTCRTLAFLWLCFVLFCAGILVPWPHQTCSFLVAIVVAVLSIWNTVPAYPQGCLFSPLSARLGSHVISQLGLCRPQFPTFKIAACKPSHSAFWAHLIVCYFSFLAECASPPNILCNLLCLLFPHRKYV